MKNIDTKSLIIGALLTSTIFLGVAAVVQSGTVPLPRVDERGLPIKGNSAIDPRTGLPLSVGGFAGGLAWNDKQVWYVKRLEWKEPPGEANRLTNRLQPQGFEPFAATDKHILFRKRTK